MKLSWKEFSNSLRVHASIKFLRKMLWINLAFKNNFLWWRHVWALGQQDIHIIIIKNTAKDFNLPETAVNFVEKHDYSQKGLCLWLCLCLCFCLWKDINLADSAADFGEKHNHSPAQLNGQRQKGSTAGGSNFQRKKLFPRKFEQLWQILCWVNLFQDLQSSKVYSKQRRGDS